MFSFNFAAFVSPIRIMFVIWICRDLIPYTFAAYVCLDYVCRVCVSTESLLPLILCVPVCSVNTNLSRLPCLCIFWQTVSHYRNWTIMASSSWRIIRCHDGNHHFLSQKILGWSLCDRCESSFFMNFKFTIMAAKSSSYGSRLDT